MKEIIKLIKDSLYYPVIMFRKSFRKSEQSSYTMAQEGIPEAGLSLIAMLLLVIILLFSSCYTSKTALRQIIKADIKTDIVPAYCASKYPAKASKGEPITTYLPGDTLQVTDTLYYQLSDTVTRLINKNNYIHDTVLIKRTDTIIDGAASEQLRRTNLQMQTLQDSDKRHIGQRNIWIWIAIGLGLSWLIFIAFKIFK